MKYGEPGNNGEMCRICQWGNVQNLSFPAIVSGKVAQTE